MQVVKCQHSGIREKVLLRATRTQVGSKLRHDLAFIVDNVSDLQQQGYAAYIISSQTPDMLKVRKQSKIGSHQPFIVYSPENYTIQEGDIIHLNPKDEALSILFESNTTHNCIYLTDKCNCRCIMCPQRIGEDTQDYAKLNNRLVSLINTKLDYITISGGEPTLTKETFLDTIHLCRKELPDTKLMVLTNARKFKHLKYAEELASISQGYAACAVPIYSDIDSIHDEIVGVSGAFAETIAGCHNLALCGMPVEIRIVIMAHNHQRLTKLADFIYRNLTFSYHVAFMGLELQESALENINKVWVDPYEYRSELLNAIQFLYRRGMYSSIYNHQLCTLPEPLWSFCAKSISRWKNIYMPECENCIAIEDCGGFFEASQNKYSSHIQAITSKGKYGAN